MKLLWRAARGTMTGRDVAGLMGRRRTLVRRIALHVVARHLAKTRRARAAGGSPGAPKP